MSLLELVLMITPPRSKELTHSREVSQQCGFQVLSYKCSYLFFSLSACVSFVCLLVLAYFCGTKLRMGETTMGALHMQTLRCRK